MTTHEEAAAATFARREQAQAREEQREACALQFDPNAPDVAGVASAIRDTPLDATPLADRIREQTLTIETLNAARADATFWRDREKNAAEMFKELEAELARLRNGDCALEGPHQAGCRDGEPQCFGCAMQRVKTLKVEAERVQIEANILQRRGDRLETELAARTEERDAAREEQCEALEEGREICALALEGAHRHGVGNCNDRARANQEAGARLGATFLEVACGNCNRADAIRAIPLDSAPLSSRLKELEAELTAERALSAAAQVALESRDAAYAVRVAELNGQANALRGALERVVQSCLAGESDAAKHRIAADALAAAGDWLTEGHAKHLYNALSATSEAQP